MPTCFIADMNECETAGIICLTILLHMSVIVLEINAYCFIADMNECETAGIICLTILLHMSVRVLEINAYLFYCRYE